MKKVVLILLTVFCSAVLGNNFKKSTDELVLKFLSHLSTPRLIGLPGSMHQLHFELLNNGNNAVFQLTQTADDGFTGQLVPGTTISIPSKNVKTISLINLTVPSTVPIGQILSLTLKAEKEQSVGGKMTEVSTTINFLVGDPEELTDDEKPVVTSEYGGSCQVPRNDTQCANYQWQIEYHVQDESSGLLGVEVLAMGRDSIVTPVFYSFPNFAIGTRDTVDVTVDTSCCAAGVSIRAIDVYGNEANVDSLRDSNGSGILKMNFFLSSIFAFIVIAKNQ